MEKRYWNYDALPCAKCGDIHDGGCLTKGGSFETFEGLARDAVKWRKQSERRKEMCWKILAEWYYECSVEELKRCSVDKSNLNAVNILDDLSKLYAILEG
jgi:hypothetical protein